MAESKADLHLATEFLKDSYVLELRGYTGDNVHYILDLLRPPRLEAVSTSGLRSSPEVVSDDVIVPTSGPSRRLKRNPDEPLQLSTLFQLPVRFSPRKWLPVTSLFRLPVHRCISTTNHGGGGGGGGESQSNILRRSTGKAADTTNRKRK